MTIRTIPAMAVTSLALLLAACANPQTAVTPIYQDQTYTKYGSGSDDNGLAGCVHGNGPMQSGTLICPGF